MLIDFKTQIQSNLLRRPLRVKSARSASEKTRKSLRSGKFAKSPGRGLADAPSSDEYCPHCDNHFVRDALTPKAALQIEGEDARVNARMLKDDRLRDEQSRSIFDVKDAPDRLG